MHACIQTTGEDPEQTSIGMYLLTLVDQSLINAYRYLVLFCK